MAQKPRGRPRSAPEKPEQATVQALDRALALLEHLARRPGLTLSDLAEETGLPIATVFRALATLQAHSMVEAQEPGQFWHIGPGAFRIGSAFLRRTDVVDRARAPMERLMRETGETVTLGAEVADLVTILAQVEAQAGIRTFHAPGSTLPMHGSALGKALLAWLPEDRVAGILDRQGQARLTSLTLTSESALLRDLVRSRDRGFAIDDQEGAEGLRGVAAPVFNAQGLPVAALAITGPGFRFGLSDAQRAGALVRAAAEAVTDGIGGTAP